MATRIMHTESDEAMHVYRQTDGQTLLITVLRTAAGVMQQL